MGRVMWRLHPEWGTELLNFWKKEKNLLGDNIGENLDDLSMVKNYGPNTKGPVHERNS